ncbi:restriction endonuclease subunit S [Lactobacillus gasseri]|uniref:restriction endonuclease subunit S n=1 Tax=Lactobacillus gasseri TaxID=1596 RepID=UPI00321B7ECE
MAQKSIGILADQIRGVSYKKKDLHDTLDKNSVILLRANNIINGELDFTDVLYVDKSVVSDTQYLKYGDILISASSGSKKAIGKAASFNSQYKCTFGAFCKIIRPHENVRDFLRIYFQSSAYRRQISHLALGANINNIRNEHINSLQLEIPNEITRKKIVNKLDLLKKIITEKQKILADLDELIKARFVEMFGDAGQLNLNFKVSKLGEVADVKSSHRVFTKDFVNTGIPFYRGKEISLLAKGSPISETYFISKELYEKLLDEKTRPKLNDLLMPSICDKGQIWRVNTRAPFYYKDGRVLCISPKKEIFNSIYLQQYMKFKTKIEYRKLGTGSTFAEFKIFQLKNMQIIIPPLSLQNEYATFVQQVDKSKVAVQKSLDETQKLFDSLMQEYFG